MDTNLETWLVVYHAFVFQVPKLLELLFYYDLQSILKFPNEKLKAMGVSDYAIQSLKAPDQQQLLLTLKWLEMPNHHLLTLDSLDYPAYLKEIAKPPPVLFIKGDKSLLQQKQLAIVGSRQASPVGLEVAYDMANALSGHFVITSGMALGIDAAAHCGALKAQGQTIAVLGSGLNCLYPARHKALAAEIADTGALVSEFPLNTAPVAYNFPRRNRIISGLSLATLIIEARLNSGSLITAEYALEQGRDVLVVPGSVRNPMAQGSNKLIQMGAQLVSSAAEILSVLGQNQGVRPLDKRQTHHSSSASTLDSEAQRLLECVGFEPTPIDSIIALSQAAYSEASSQLLELELEGYIHKEALGYRRVK